MLLNPLIHPEISAVLARAGHHAQVLIADGNYPASTKKGPNATLVSLNLRPGLVTVAQVLETLLASVPVDAVYTMGVPPDDPYAIHGDPPVWADYHRIVSQSSQAAIVTPIEKWKFYEAVQSPDHVLTIQTGDQALWANVLLTLGCRTA